jgi:nucleotide-binding universal stress UspA family protein
MKKVLAALDTSLAATPVLIAARALGNLLGAEVEAIHVAVDGGEQALRAAEIARVPLHLVGGDVVDQLVGAGEAEDVTALVIGAHGLPTDPRPLGATAEAVATRVRKPVLVVPPDSAPPPVLKRILVPLEGSISSSLAPRSLIELAEGAQVDVVALHVLGIEQIPPFTDQPQHEQVAWATEFLARHCPWGIGTVQLELRIGRTDELVPLVAQECGCDLIALGWAQELAAGRAPVVRAALERARRQVLLVPVYADPVVQPSSRALQSSPTLA